MRRELHRKTLGFILLVCFSGLLSAVPVRSSADDVSGVVTGYAFEQNHHPIKGARVVLASPESPGKTVHRNTADLVSLSLQASAATYRVGQPIMLKVSLRNEFPERIVLWADAPWWGCDLLITDQNGDVVNTTHYKNSQNFHTLHGIPIAPGQTIALEWDLKPWWDLANWGYDLKTPGKYKIRAIPSVGGEFATSPNSDADARDRGYFQSDAKTVKSNQLEIQITQ